MAFPLFSFLLFGSLAVLTLVATSWLAHARPADAEARRVSDAVERAGVGQLVASAPLAGAALALLAASHAALGRAVGWSASVTALLPLVGAGLGVAACHMGAMRLCRASGQLACLSGRDALAAHAARSAGSAAVFVASAAAALAFGSSWLAGALGEAPPASAAPLLSTAGATMALLVTSRAALVSWSAAERGTVPVADGALEPGSLARLVGSAYGAGFARSAALFGLVSMGVAALLASGDAAPGQLPLERLTLGLPLLGVLGALFGALGVRATETEAAGWAWVRGALVAAVVLVGGVWSLQLGLAEDPATTRLAALSTLLVAGALAALGFAAVRARAGAAPFAAAAGTALLSALLLVALGSGEAPLPSRALVSIWLAVGVAGAPLLAAPQLAADAASAAERVRALAWGGATPPGEVPGARAEVALSASVLGTAALLGLGVYLGALALAAPRASAHESLDLLLLALGAALGAAWAALFEAQVERAAARGGAAVSDLARTSAASGPSVGAVPALAPALHLAASAGTATPLSWLALSLAPALAAGALAALGAPSARPLLPGLLVGVTLLAARRLGAAAGGGAFRDVGASRALAPLPLTLAALGVVASMAALPSNPGAASAPAPDRTPAAPPAPAEGAEPIERASGASLPVPSQAPNSPSPPQPLGATASP